MVLDPLVDEEKSQKTLGLIAFIGTVAALISTWYTAQSPGVGFSNTVRVDNFSIFFTVLVILIAAVVILSSFEYMAVQQIRAGEYYALILFSVVGMALMSSAIELVMIFIGAGNLVDLHLHSRRVPAQRSGEQRIVAQIFPSRLIRDRVLPVWRGVDLRRYRIDQYRCHRRQVAVGPGRACWSPRQWR